MRERRSASFKLNTSSVSLPALVGAKIRVDAFLTMPTAG
jgi:hypothetical protein